MVWVALKPPPRPSPSRVGPGELASSHKRPLRSWLQGPNISTTARPTPARAQPLSPGDPLRARAQKVPGSERCLPLLSTCCGWVSGDRREAGKPRRNQRSARVGDEPQEMLSSKNMPFLKGKQSLEGVRSPRGEESKTVRLTGRPVEQQRSPLPTHFLRD